MKITNKMKKKRSKTNFKSISLHGDSNDVFIAFNALKNIPNLPKS